MSGSNRGYSFRISAEGMREFAADVRRLAGESDGASIAFGKLIQASPDLASALLKAEDATKRAADRARELRDAQERAAAAAAALPAATARAADSFGQLENRTNAARRAVGDLRGALNLLGGGAIASALGPVGQQLGNISDLFGTAGLAANQFGTVISTVGRLATPVGLALAGVAVATTDWGDATDRLRGSLQSLRGVAYDATVGVESHRQGIDGLIESLMTAEQAERRLAQAARERQISTLNTEAAGIRPQLVAAERRLAELAPIAEQVRLARETAGRDTTISGAAARRFADFERVSEDVRRLREQLETREAAVQDLLSVPVFAPAVTRPAGVSAAGSRAAPPDPLRTIYESGVEGTVFPVEVEGFLRRNREREEREAEQARQQREREERDHLRRIEQANQRTTDSIVNYAAGAFADLWQNTGGGFDAMMARLRQTAIQTFARIAAEAVIRPIVAPIVQGLGLVGGGAGGFGGLQSLGLPGLPGVGGFGGFGGIGSSVSGFLNTPLFNLGGGPTMPVVTGDPGFFGQTGLIGGNVAPVPFTAGMGLSALGYGYGAYSGFQRGGVGGATQGIGNIAAMAMLLNPATAPFAPLVALGSSLLGGALPGQKPSNREGNATYDFATGRLVAGGQDGAKFSQANRDAAGQLGATLRDSLANIALAVDGTLPTAGGFRIGAGDRDGLFFSRDGQTRRYGRNDAETLLGDALRDLIPGITGGLSGQFRTAIDTAGATGAEEIGGIAAWFATVFRPLTEIREPVEEFAEAMRLLNQTYDDAIRRAKELGLSEAELQAGRQRAIAELEQQRSDRAAGVLAGPVASLADFVRGLRVANDNPLSPLGRLDAARGEFERTIAAALDGDLGAFGRVQGSAQALLSVSRNVNGSGGGFAADFEATLARLESLSGLSQDALTGAVFAAETRSQTDILRDELQRLRAEIVGLRSEVQQGNRIPDRFAA
jgi:hypothetical protein